MSMKLFLVRHGSTDLVEKRISQYNDTPLNDKGHEQAKSVAQRFENVKLDMIISSPHTRALETAKAISEKVEINELFSEVKKPEDIVGHSKDDSEVKQILKKISEMYLVDPKWHYKDEENYEDLKTRALKAIKYLEKLDLENVLVVSHANFMALMVGLMFFGEDLDVKTSLKWKSFLRFSATGISICTFEDEKWQLQTWNDRSHWME